MQPALPEKKKAAPQSVLDFFEDIHRQGLFRTGEEIDRDLQAERDAWDSEEDSTGFTTEELMTLAEKGGSFDFWYTEPDIYTLEDGEAIQW
jgi:hypothetical protein